MSDFAINLINALSASATSRDETARSALKEFDANGDGKISSQEFQKMFALLQREEQLSGAQWSGQSSTFRSSGVRPTVFDCTLYPSFSKNYALSQYQATEMLHQFDGNGDNQVSLDELRGVTPTPPTPPTPPSATTQADAFMSSHDKTNKGYVTQDDITAAWTTDPVFANVSQLPTTVVTWDASGDGKISLDELVSGFTVINSADHLMTQLAPTPANPADPRAIQISSVTDAQLQTLNVTRDLLTSWDTDKNGALTRQELLAGLGALEAANNQPPPTPEQRADALMAEYDKTNKGYVTISDITSAWVNDPSLGDISQLGNTMEAWDSNADGQITRSELVSGFTIMDAADGLLIQLAQPPAKPTDPVAIQLADVTDAQLQPLGVTRDQLTGWDTDKNGAVTREELMTGLRALSLAPPTAQDYAQAMLTNFDADKDGALNFDEFQKALAASALDASTAQSNFDAWDLNKDGLISKDELTTGIDIAQQATLTVAKYDRDNKGYFNLADLQAAIDASPDKATSATAEEMMAAWDTNGDGKVTAQDIITVQQMQKTAAPPAA